MIDWDNISTDKRPKHKGWCPGNYTAKCHNCGCSFFGDKRAISCAPCAHGDSTNQIEEVANPKNCAFHHPDSSEFDEST